MPLYEYECEECEHRFERIRKFSDEPLSTCPVCSGPVRKLASAPAIQFKGTGWYITDYSRKSGDGKSAEGGNDAESAKSANGADGKPSSDGKSSGADAGSSGSDGKSSAGASSGSDTPAKPKSGSASGSASSSSAPG